MLWRYSVPVPCTLQILCLSQYFCNHNSAALIGVAVHAQSQAPKIIIDLDVHVNSVEFRTSFNSSLQPLVKLPSNVKVSAINC